MNLDIATTVRTIFVMLLLAGIALTLAAVRAFREASRLRFFLKRRELLGRAWKFIFFAMLVVAAAFLINIYAEPVTYRYFQASPTPTLTPTVTQTPTITETPTITPTATITPTLEFTPTPEMPAAISEGFTSIVTPNPKTIFSKLSFARTITKENLPINASDNFENPIEKIYGTYSYDGLQKGVQLTALWFRDGELICYETTPWEHASGGYAYTDCLIPAEEWLPGAYEVQMYVGETWKVTGTFTVTGEPPTPTATFTATTTLTQTPTLTPTVTLTPSLTPTATNTKIPTGTPLPIATLAPTSTPTQTPTPTRTMTATPTATQTNIPTLTLVPTATRHSTIYR